MTYCTNLRKLRLVHGITLDELATAAGVSNQYISRAELREIQPTWSLEKKCEAAMEQLIVRRQEAARALERDYRALSGYLFDSSEEEAHGI